jgi:hypothetical protein
VRPKTITFRYTGEGCAGSDNDQGSWDQCSSSSSGHSPVTIKIMDYDQLYLYVNQSGVEIGDLVTAAAANAGRTTMTSRTSYWIKNSWGYTKESGMLKTSCEKPLGVGDQFGSLEVVAMSFAPYP